MPSDELIRELCDIFQEDYGVSVSDIDAQKAAAWLTAYFDALAEIAANLDKQ